MDNFFLGNINKSIGDNMRFVRDFQANPEKYASPPQAPDPAEQLATMLNPLLMLMLFQMMQQMMSRQGSGLPPEGYKPAALTEPALSTPPSAGAPASGVPQNPATQYLDGLLQANPLGSAQDTASVQAALNQGEFSHLQLGQALMYLLDQGALEHLPGVSRLLSDLTDAGEVNVVPFLENNYLGRLSTERREALLAGVERAGLRMDNDRPNTRFIGFMLETLSRDGDTPARQLVQRFLQDFYEVHGESPETPVGRILSQVIELAGVTVDEDKTLRFP